MRTLFSALLCACLLTTAACGVSVLPETKRSEHFMATAKHLDLGGQVYLYADLDGDIEKLTALISEWFEELKKEDPDLAKIDLEKLVALLGFNQIKAVGLSSYKAGDLFHNKGIIYHPAKPTGFMRLAGDGARPFETPAWAPADADLVFEQDYNFHGGFSTVEAMLREVMGAEADQALAELSQPIPQMHVSVRQIIEKLDTRIVGVVRIHEGQLIQIPGEDFSFPFTELAIGVDGLAFVFDDLVETFGGMPMLKVTADEDFHSIAVTAPLPEALALYKPVLAKDVKTGRVYFATSLALLREFVPGPKSLGKSKDFRQATRGLPTRGNGLTYMSAGFIGKLMTWMNKLGEQDEEMAIMMRLVQALVPEKGVAMASCNGMLPDGFVFASNSSASHKLTIMAFGYANPMMIGMLAAIAIPTFIGYRDAAASVEVPAQPLPAAAPPEPAAPVPAPAPAKSK